MSAAIKVWDPYRNRETTFSEFAKAEGCKRMAVYLYYRRHGSLERFRNRPTSGNGITPHTYTYRGAYIRICDACKRFRIRAPKLAEFKRSGITEIEEMLRLVNKRREERKVLRRTDDGRLMTASEFAREKGVTRNTVYTYLRNHGGSLAGFDNRLVSRITIDLPAYDPKTGKETKVSKVAKKCRCGIDTVRNYYRKHNTLNGFRKHLRSKACHGVKLKFRGEERSVAEWADIFRVSSALIRKYYNRHGTLEGFDCRRRTHGREGKLIEFRGENHTLTEWARRFGTYYQVVRNYYLSKGTLEGFDCRRETRGRKGKEIEFRGEKHTFAEWARRFGSYYHVVRNYYLSRGTLEGFENRRQNGRRRQ